MPAAPDHAGRRPLPRLGFVVPQLRTLGQRDHRLAQHPLMATHHRMGGTTTMGRGEFELFTGRSLQRDPLDGPFHPLRDGCVNPHWHAMWPRQEYAEIEYAG